MSSILCSEPRLLMEPQWKWNWISTYLSSSSGPPRRASEHPHKPITRIIRRSQHSQKCKDSRRHGSVSRDLDHKISGFLGLIVDHLYVKFDYPSCIGFLRNNAEKQTDKQTAVKTLPRHCRRRGYRNSTHTR